MAVPAKQWVIECRESIPSGGTRITTARSLAMNSLHFELFYPTQVPI